MGEIKAKYELWEYDSGMGGPFDGKSRLVGYFSSLEKAINFFRKNDITVDYDNKKVDFDLDKGMYVKDKNRGLGAHKYTLKPLQKPSHKIDPLSLSDLRG
jgi:hypothetical protein